MSFPLRASVPSCLRAFLLLAALLPLHALAAPSTPNIVIILADDLGYGDVSAYGATRVQTPNVDRLAKEGIRFTDAHAIVHAFASGDVHSSGAEFRTDEASALYA